MNSFSKAFLRLEERMIDAQYDIDKLEAGKEFHQQKLRLIHIQIEEKNEELTQKFQENLNILPGKKPLTKRELEIFSHLLSGLSDKDMSEKMAVSLPTIKFHLQNIYKKSGINGRKGVLKIISSYKMR